MRETITLNGVVLLAQPVGEYDRRLVVLTPERGKITVFAHGARRQKSAFLAATNPFVFASFTLYEGRDAYTLVQAEVREYFHSLSSRYPGVFYGFYFMELAAWYTREGLEAEGIVNLIFVTLRALDREQVPVTLIRRVFELRMLVENGEYALPPETDVPDRTVWKALSFVASVPPGKLYTFRLEPAQEAALAREVQKALSLSCQKEFKSLAVIEEMKYSEA